MIIQNRIPVFTSLPIESQEKVNTKNNYNKKRLLKLSLYSVLIAVCISFIAKFLVHLIDLITNISFYGKFSMQPANPAHNTYGWWVIIIPVIGGLIIGLMALFGSKAIRGHGIPEAMEQILTNESKIRPSITFLKPLSAAISIGTGGPYGAEGPIIATGGALGSTLGQILNITPNERKILLTCGATAGMSAIFGSPVAGIFLAIELLLFEYSARSFIPVALACITGAAGHHFLFEEGVVFPIKEVLPTASNYALTYYSAIGIAMGFIAVAVTKIVYGIEDLFEKLPIHWAWWPAIGAIAVGVVGYYEPRTLGVGYYNITDILSGTMPLMLVASLCILKFTSWSISLGSGTSGGTLAPLLTIGGALGLLMGALGEKLFPNAGISIQMSALVAMSAMFAGASRAFLTSIVFALETTGQVNALLPLLATCTSAYFVSYFLMDNTIMTEKIARRGVYTPDYYGPDLLENVKAKEVATEGLIISSKITVREIRNWLEHETDMHANYFIIADEENKYAGLLSSATLFNSLYSEETEVSDLIKRKDIFAHPDDSLKSVVEMMVNENVDLLPIIANNEIMGVLSHTQILSVLKNGIDEDIKRTTHISLNRQRLKILVRGQKLMSFINRKKK